MNDYLDFIKHAVGENENFTLKGRNLYNLALMRDEWHMGLSNSEIKNYREWDGSPLPNKTFIRNKSKVDETFYKFIQIKNSKDLQIEGRIMRNCIASYIDSCIIGECAIWSMEVEQPGSKSKKTLTIEVRGKQIVQIRRKTNGSATKADRGIVRTWAKYFNINMLQQSQQY